MGTGQLFSRSVPVALCGALATFVATVVLVAPAGAWAHDKAPEYSLSVVEGADTQPADTIERVSASASENAEVSVSLTHNGLVVALDTGEGYAGLSQVPQVGDVVTFASQGFTTAVTYDGLPTIDPTVCVGSNNFSGQRTLGYTVEGGYYTVTPARRHIYHSQDTLAQIQVLSRSSAATPSTPSSRLPRHCQAERRSPTPARTTARSAAALRRRRLLLRHRRSRSPERSRNSHGLRSPSCFTPDGRRM
jgi:hypothetical protein